MPVEELIIAFFFILGIVSIFYPVVIIYTFATLPIVSSIPTIPTDIDLQLLKIGTINLFVYDYLIIISFLIMLKLALLEKVNHTLSIREIIKFRSVKVTLLLFAWNIFIGILSYQKGFKIQNVLRLLSYQFIIILCFLIPKIITDKKSKTRFFFYCVVLGSTLVLFAIIRYLTNDVNFTSSGTIRVLSSNANPVLIFAISCILFFNRFKKNIFFSKFIVVSFISLGVFLSGYRSGFLVLAFVLASFFIQEIRNRVDYIWVPFFCIAGIFMLIFLFVNGIISPNDRNLISQTLQRSKDTFDLQNRTTQDRLLKWDNAIKIVKSRPLLGLGRYPFKTSYIDTDNSAQSDIFSELEGSAHNMIIHKLVHEGIIGLFLLLLFFFIIFSDSFKIFSEVPGNVIFLIVYFASYILYSMFNTVFDNVNGRIFFFISLGFLNVELANSCIFKKNMNNHFRK